MLTQIFSLTLRAQRRVKITWKQRCWPLQTLRWSLECTQSAHGESNVATSLVVNANCLLSLFIMVSRWSHSFSSTTTSSGSTKAMGQFCLYYLQRILFRTLLFTNGRLFQQRSIWCPPLLFWRSFQMLVMVWYLMTWCCLLLKKSPVEH